MIEIRALEALTQEELQSFGHNGYKTDKIIDVQMNKSGTKMQFDLVEKTLDEVYVKTWRPASGNSDYFQDIINQGHSFGVYHEGTLIGFALLSYYAWNNSMWIENIRIAEDWHGKGVGRSVIEYLIEYSKEKKARILGLETQSTNYPAIKFYEKCGFDISGIDFARYPQRENDLEQVAILMKVDI